MTIKLNTKFDGPLVAGAPEGFRLDNLVKDFEGEIFYILGILYNRAQLYVGPKSNLAEAKVTKHEILRDGGTVIIQFNLEGRVGELFFPGQYIKEPTSVTYDHKKTELLRIV